jgi:hypothetical protein
LRSIRNLSNNNKKKTGVKIQIATGTKGWGREWGGVALLPQHDDVISVVIVLEMLCANNRQFSAFTRTSPQIVQFDCSIYRLLSHAAISGPFPAQNANETAVDIRNDDVIAGK